MTWKGERRKQLPSNWGAIRKAVLVRDGYRCTFLASFEVEGSIVQGRCQHCATDVDHILPGSDHSFRNLRSLCAGHHKQKTQAEAKQAQAAKSRARTKQPHPGLR